MRAQFSGWSAVVASTALVAVSLIATGPTTRVAVPPEQIRPTCDEGLAAVLALRAAYGSAPRR